VAAAHWTLLPTQGSAVGSLCIDTHLVHHVLTHPLALLCCCLLQVSVLTNGSAEAIRSATLQLITPLPALCIQCCCCCCLLQVYVLTNGSAGWHPTAPNTTSCIAHFLLLLLLLQVSVLTNGSAEGIAKAVLTGNKVMQLVKGPTLDIAMPEVS
jgi:uncharacterized membrane protein YozB (DUF420 family)